MIITISGKPGAGKSTIGHLLAEKLKYKYYDIGQVRRKMAEDMGLTLHELNELGEKDHSTDTIPDRFAEDIGQKNQDAVVVGRTSFHFIPHSFKVFLDVHPEKAAHRIIKHNRKGEEYKGILHAIEKIRKRQDSDAKRFKEYYKLDVFDLSQYDYVIDTTDLTKEQVVDKIIKKANSIIKKKSDSFIKEH